MMTGAGPSHKPVSHVSTEFSSFRVKHHRNRYVKLLLSCCDSCHQISSCHWLRRRGWTRKTSRWTGWSRCWGTWSWSRWVSAAASLISFLSSCVGWVEWLSWQSEFMTSVCPRWLESVIFCKTLNWTDFPVTDPTTWMLSTNYCHSMILLLISNNWDKTYLIILLDLNRRNETTTPQLSIVWC